MKTKTKIEPMVNLNVNPCKMCMPMGAVTALYGIKHSMSILHGSQGCSTYIRRHMATHYNDPVDIASSSLTEHGTVYGGEENLVKGLKNMIDLYHPKVIGVSTTCLAETIGEDIVGMIARFKETYIEYEDITILPIHSPGYGGTQYEGFYATLLSIVKNVPMKQEKVEKVNVITGQLSPADTRFLKEAFAMFDIDIILLPDLSENLDGVYQKTYERLPSHGTDIEDIKQMGGAKLTIEFCTAFEGDSPAKYLFDTYGVPYQQMNLPIGLRDTNAFYKMLSQIANKKIPQKVKNSRGRYLDAMIDSHKYNGDGRGVVFGEPDFVYGTIRLLAENGVMPLIAATGSNNRKLNSLLHEEMKAIADLYFIDSFYILDDVDFKTIESFAKKLNANILIGNSDGRRMEEELRIPLVRRGFPIHDRVGGQRQRMLGYTGSLQFLDEITNALLMKKETSFRDELYQEYYVKGGLSMKEQCHMEGKSPQEMIEDRTKTHPCFTCGSESGTKYARIHLPVAPKCNVQCNYCVRKYDCPNESRPGVTTAVLSPKEAFERYLLVKEKVKNLSVVGIAGPGDALANFDEVKETLELIREDDKDVTFCLSTNGLMLPTYAEQLIELGVTHVTVTLNAVDPKITAKIYKYVDFMGTRYVGEAAGAIILTNQLAGLRMLCARGIVCKVNIVMLKGINDTHIPEVVKKVKEIGCYITNIMPMIPVKGSAFEGIELTNNLELMEMRNSCGETMKQMYHCRQCRADAIGTLDHDVSIEYNKCDSECATTDVDKIAKVARHSFLTYRFAVATKSGMLVDEHFGHATEFYIYETKNDKVTFIEKRNVNQYCTEDCPETTGKISSMIETIKDCDGVIAMRIGESPKSKLEEMGIAVIPTYDRVEDAVRKAAAQMVSTSSGKEEEALA